MRCQALAKETKLRADFDIGVVGDGVLIKIPNGQEFWLINEQIRDALGIPTDLDSYLTRVAGFQTALKEIAGMVGDTLGTRDSSETPSDTRAAFDRGTSMAFHRCAEVAKKALGVNNA